MNNNAEYDSTIKTNDKRLYVNRENNELEYHSKNGIGILKDLGYVMELVLPPEKPKSINFIPNSNVPCELCESSGNEGTTGNYRIGYENEYYMVCYEHKPSNQEKEDSTSVWRWTDH